MVKLKNLTLGYGRKTVLSNINLDIKHGEVVAIVGESGCGKSSLMSHLYKLDKENIAWCPQDANLIPALSAFHNIYAGTLNEHSFLYNLGNLTRPYKIEFSKVAELASKLNLEDILNLSVDQLSGGQQQRVNIARAMIQKHSLFLGDEPVSALDDFHKRQVIQTITKQFPTCIFALHDLDLALTCCHRIIGIGQGKIIFDEPVSNISRQQLSKLYSHLNIRHQVNNDHIPRAHTSEF